MTFEEYLAKQGMALRPWQKEASEEFLKVVHGQRGSATGKSLLAWWMSRFIDDYGNEFEIKSKEGE